MPDNYIRNVLLSKDDAIYINTLGCYFYHNPIKDKMTAKMSISDGLNTIMLHNNSSGDLLPYISKLMILSGMLSDYLYTISQKGEACTFSNKKFLNLLDNPANGWCSIYHGKISTGTEMCISIGDCLKVVQIKKKRCDTFEEYVTKITNLADNISEYINFLDNL